MTFGSLFSGMNLEPAIGSTIENDLAALDEFHGQGFEILVNGHVLGSSARNEILGAVIGLDAVDVVDHFPRCKLPSEMFLHHEDVLGFVRKLTGPAGNGGAGGQWAFDPADLPHANVESEGWTPESWGECGERVAESGVGGMVDGFPPRLDGGWGYTPRVATGVANRVDRLRGLGNAVVPAVAQFVGERILEWDSARTREHAS